MSAARPGRELGNHARGFGDAHHDAGKIGLGKAPALNAHGVGPDGEQRGGERAVRSGFDVRSTSFVS